MDIADKLEQLAKARQMMGKVKEVVQMHQSYLERTLEWEYLSNSREDLKQIQDKVSTLEDEVRQIAVQIFDGVNKKPVAGIEIKRFDTIKVTDEKKALAWASQNAPSLLNLDRKKFDKAVENLELDFIEKGVEYRAQIASVLSEYLKDENV